MTESKPVAVVIQEPYAYWRIELRSLGACRQALGPDVLNSFCRCFVQVDRLTSLIGFAYLSRMQGGRTSRAFAHNLQTMVWFIVGTLSELVTATRDLRGALAQRGVLHSESDAWRALQAVEDRWKSDSFFRTMCHVAAFHVDPGLIDRGLALMEGAGAATLSEGQGGRFQHSSMRLGLEALFNGTGMGLADFDRFMKDVSEDHGISTAIHDAFLLALDAAGIPVEEADADASPA